MKHMNCPVCQRHLGYQGDRAYCGKCRQFRAASDEWPIWAKLIAKRRKAGEIGVGQTFRRIASRWGGEKLKRVATHLDLPCGCTDREADWNRRYPYAERTEESVS